MAYLWVIFGLWLLWNVLILLFSTPEWFPQLLMMVFGIGGACLVDPTTWWYGVGLAGAANLLMLIGDLLLVTTDAVRTGVLRRNPRR
jgi:hypothetical protein